MSHLTKDKGDLGVAHVITSLTEMGWTIGLPLSEHKKYDLFIEKDLTVLTVQVRYVTPNKDSIRIRLMSSWSDRNSNHIVKRKMGDYDVLAVYVPGYGVYYITDKQLQENGCTFTLRLTKPINNQTIGVHFADDYRILPL